MLKEAFDRSFFIFAVLALVTGTACYLKLGMGAFSESLLADAAMVGFLIPKLGAALLVAAFLQVLLPPAVFARHVGEERGVKGMAIASAAGMVTPGGPMTSFPLVTVMRDGGTGISSLVAYVTAWATNGLQRILMWEVPLMGAEFAIVRFLASAPLSIVAGALAKLQARALKADADGGSVA